MKTLQQAAKDAIEVQSACNLSGVLHSFAAAMVPISEEMQRLQEGTDWRNNHPIVRLFVDKLASLSHMQGSGGFENYAAAYEACQEIMARPVAGQPATVKAIWHDPTKQPQEYTVVFQSGRYLRMLVEPPCPNDPNGVTVWCSTGANFCSLKEPQEIVISWSELPERYQNCVRETLARELVHA